MRNILVFPDGKEQDFMYPPNRDITVGVQLQIQMDDDSTRVMSVKHIQKTDKEIYYHLDF